MKNPKDTNSLILDLDDHKEPERNKSRILTAAWEEGVKAYLNGERLVIEVKESRAARRRE